MLLMTHYGSQLYYDCTWYYSLQTIAQTSNATSLKMLMNHRCIRFLTDAEGNSRLWRNWRNVRVHQRVCLFLFTDFPVYFGIKISGLNASSFLHIITKFLQKYSSTLKTYVIVQALIWLSAFALCKSNFHYKQF